MGPILGLTLESVSSRTSTIWTSKASNPEPIVMIKSNPMQENGLRNAGEPIRLMPVLNLETLSDFSDFAWFPPMISDSSSVTSYFAPLMNCKDFFASSIFCFSTSLWGFSVTRFDYNGA